MKTHKKSYLCAITRSKMGRKWILAALVASVLLGAPVGCGRRARYTVVDGTMLGTTLHVAADVRGLTAQELRRRILALDAEAKASMSIFDSLSLLSRLNRNETDSVDRHIAFNLRLADSIGALSGGAYDVTVKPLTEAYGFAARQRTEAPNIDSLLQFVGRGKVRIEAGRLVKSDPRVQLDFNSIAKGYTVDLLAALVEACGAENYLVDIGGELRCRGTNPSGQAWRIGVETPFDGNMTDGEYLQQRLQLQEGALATSGNYRRFYRDAAGNKVAHTIDPRTGRSSLSRLLSVTVAAPTCAEADALGTMFLAMGADEALAAVERMEGVKAYFILAPAEETADSTAYETYVSPAMRPLLMER